jgi:cytidyltransferase-like protein
VTAVVVSASFDDLRSRDVRLLEEASRLGEVHVLLWSDETVRALGGREPKCPQAERLYVVASLRYVRAVTPVSGLSDGDALPEVPGLRPDLWVVDERSDSAGRRQSCEGGGVRYRVVRDEELRGFPKSEGPPEPPPPGRKRVLVTGCYDWLHSGHVRFFEEVSQLGDLYVVVGHDTNIRFLKGEGHPLFGESERRYMVQAVRHVTAALISTGMGWLDAEPEILRIRPDIYAVNEDGDRPEKSEYCEAHGIEYVVLKRLPKEGLPRRQSTALRGF